MDKSTIRECVRGYIRGDLFPDDEQAAADLIAYLEDGSNVMEELVDLAIESIGSVQERYPSATYETAVDVGMDGWRKELPSRIQAVWPKQAAVA
jgi:hypothetical protein